LRDFYHLETVNKMIRHLTIKETAAHFVTVNYDDVTTTYWVHQIHKNATETTRTDWPTVSNCYLDNDPHTYSTSFSLATEAKAFFDLLVAQAGA